MSGSVASDLPFAIVEGSDVWLRCLSSIVNSDLLRLWGLAVRLSSRGFISVIVRRSWSIPDKMRLPGGKVAILRKMIASHMSMTKETRCKPPNDELAMNVAKIIS